MFLLMVGVALIRKPGCVTAMVFMNYLLAQLLFGSGHGALDWTDGLTQGIFCDLYIVARRGRVYAPGASQLVDGDRRAHDRGAARRAERVPGRLDLRPVPQLDLLHAGTRCGSTPGRTRSATAWRRRSARRWRLRVARRRWCPRWAPGGAGRPRPAADPFAEPPRRRPRGAGRRGTTRRGGVMKRLAIVSTVITGRAAHPGPGRLADQLQLVQTTRTRCSATRTSC